MIMQQGDVILEKIDCIPDGCKEVPLIDAKIILAYGEITGHRHAIDNIAGVKFLEKDGLFYLQTPIGVFRKKIVKEYDHFTEEAREVRD